MDGGVRRRKPKATARRVLPEMQRLGRQGLYREAIRAFLTLPYDRKRVSITGRRAELYLQYAIALQHAGLFGLAKDVYERVASATSTEKSSEVSAAVYNARMQIAVLEERFGEPAAALALLESLGEPAAHKDVGLARASLNSWASITRMKSLLVLNRRRELRKVATALSAGGDWNEQIWAGLCRAILDSGNPSAKRARAAEIEIRNSVDLMRARDPSGAPWISLLAGRFVADARLSREFLEDSHAHATRLGKFFVIAEAAEHLAQIRDIPLVTRKWYLRRAISAYARCGLLLLLPFSPRLFRAASAFWGWRFAQQCILQSAHLLEARENLVFSRMCVRLAKEKRYGDQPWQVFEEFVKDWAIARYPGEYKDVAVGQATADAMIVQKGGTILLQSKHVQNPRAEIPDTMYINELRDQYPTIPKVTRYIFVVTSSRPEGWRDDMWNAGLTRKLQNKFIDSPIKVDVIREPELQTDVLLDDALYDKYFGAGVGRER